MLRDEPDSKSLTVTTLNVNGIRAAFRKGLGDWLAEFGPDVLLLQEVRAEPAIAQSLLGQGWETIVSASSIKGRSGVGVAVNRNSGKVKVSGEPVWGLGEDEADVDTGRWLEVPVITSGGELIRMISAYFHAGQLNDPKQDAKMAHLAAIDRRMAALLEETNAAGKPQSLVGGDFNVVRGARDVKNWKGNYGRTSGVLDEEMQFLNRWVDEGWGDTVRNIEGDVNGPYSWWSWRGRAFDNDTGWRIDYHYATPALAGRAHRHVTHKAPAYDQRISDHAAVTVAYRL